MPFSHRISLNSFLRASMPVPAMMKLQKAGCGSGAGKPGLHSCVLLLSRKASVQSGYSVRVNSPSSEMSVSLPPGLLSRLLGESR
jgi:hypothetical protein